MPPIESAAYAALRDRWLTLTRDTLPAMAGPQHWPIHADHCFMRVCLDHAVGERWDRVVKRPAIRHLTMAQLAAAVATAERIIAEPESLTQLNTASLRMRRDADSHRSLV